MRLPDGSSFRRMRLRADGRVYDFVDFVFEVNFANLQDFSNQSTAATTVGAVGITDSNLIFHDIPVVGNVRVGHFLPPISLEHMTSSNFVYYMERSPQFDAFVNRFDYVNGINFFDSYYNDRITLASALFRSGSTTINPFGAGAGDGEYGVAIRSTALPIYEDKGRKLVHLGMTVMERTLDNHSTSPGDRALVRAGATKTDLPNVMQTGTWYSPYGEYYLVPEFAMVLGRLSFSGEYLYTFAPSAYTGMTAQSVLSGPRGMVSYQGFYVESGYFLTEGDYRRYNKKQGSWDRTQPLENAWMMRGKDGRISYGRGAMQLLARFSYLDLHSGQPVLSPTVGARAGIENDVTLGLAWYINSEMNFQVNYVHTQINSVLRSASGSFDGLGIRFHYDF
ncbi:porin [Aquisphaera insulae]|uniref:porin n=1 Tax=Aquisphaera insulae TaxID=2712864 RepID=UPI003F71100B